MPLHIARVEADMDITALAPSEAPAAVSTASSSMDVERLRPIVLQILQEEMAAFRRQQG